MSIERSRAWSGSSIRMKDADSGLARTRAEVRVSMGKPGALVTAVKRRSPRTARTPSCEVTSHTWEPSHSVTRLAALPPRSSASCGGGSTGETRAIGYAGAVRRS